MTLKYFKATYSKSVHLSMAFLLASILAPTVSAEMYKYQDDKGRWHFTDRVPESAKGKAQSLSSVGKPSREKAANHTPLSGEASRAKLDSDTSAGKDLVTRLTNRFEPDTPVEVASMAVVGVASRLGGGSGFFLTESGYIVTNRHVIRPNKNTDEYQKGLEKELRKIQTWGDRLESRKRKLDKYAQELRQYKRDIQGGNGKASAVDQADYDYRYGEYREAKDEFSQEYAKYKKASGEAEKEQSELNWTMSMARVAKTFDVSTKDQKKYKARLVHISDKYDLALLKIDDVITPVLPPGKSKHLSQGERVFAIGSPLGQRDSVTSGVITRVSSKVVITDTQILPGNSGGPLIDENGNVVAVNTLKVAQRRGAEGFGHSIPIEVVFQEFEGKF